MEKTLSEILGSIEYGTPNQQHQQAPNNTNIYGPNQQAPGAQLNRNAPHMYGWQQDIVNQIQQHDLFIITRTPGGGKTLPVFVYWADELLGLNTRLFFSQNIQGQLDNLMAKIINIFVHPEKLPKILWCTPFRALNDQTITQEFETSFIQLFQQMSNKLQEETYNSLRFPNPVYPPINEKLFNIMREISNNNQMIISLNIQIYRKIDEFQQNQDQSVRTFIVEQINKLNIELFALYEKIIKQYIKHRLLGNEYENDHTGIDPKTGTPKPVVVSIYESARNIIHKYKPGTLRLLVFDEIQRVHLSDNVDITYDQRAYQISDAINTILKAKAVNRATGKNPARLILLSGTENETAANNLVYIYNVGYNRNFPVNVDMLDVGNVANITIRPLDKLRDDNYIVQLIKEIIARKERSSAFLFFNKQKIRDIVSRSISGMNPDIFAKQKTNVGSVSKKYYEPNDAKIISGQADASRIVNPLLRKAVSSGLGFTYSLKPDDIGYYPEIQQDNQIVQELFRSGKIYVLLATDNIEAGMNINIKNLYIPKFEKRREQIPITSRSQILNRVGRQPIECSIYTPSEYIDDIEEAINAVNEDYPTTPVAMSAAMKRQYMKKLADEIIKDPVRQIARIIRKFSKKEK